MASEGISALDKSQGQQDGTEQTLPEVANFITLGWNIAKKELLPRFCDSQADEPDSDDPDKDSPCDKVEQQSLSKRNSCFFKKHPVTVQYISKPVGQGLMAAEDLAKGVAIPCKGPWFRSLHQMRQWLGQLHPDTCQMFKSRVVRLDLKSSTPDSDKPDMLYQVITNPCGFVNHYRLLGKINCKLEWQEGEPLGQRSLIRDLLSAIGDPIVPISDLISAIATPQDSVWAQSMQVQPPSALPVPVPVGRYVPIYCPVCNQWLNGWQQWHGHRSGGRHRLHIHKHRLKRRAANGGG